MIVQKNAVSRPLTRAEKTGIILFILAGFLYFFHPYWAIFCLSLFLVLCCAGPFFPSCGFFLPVISQGKTGKPGTPTVMLTFDDGPSPLSTPIVLELLARYKLKATFFLIGEKAAQYPDLVTQILEQGHSVGNHSWKHDYFLMLRKEQEIKDDLARTQQVLRGLGAEPVFFRPPAGITGPRLTQVVRQEKLITLAYSCRAYDRGNRNIHDLAQKIIKRLKPGNIILLHDLPPFYRINNTEKHAIKMEEWQRELDKLFKILTKCYDVLPLQRGIAYRHYLKEEKKEA